MMDRPQMLQTLEAEREWDIIIIGGGATGLGTAVDAAARGYRTLLLEQADFAKGTSSRSTKLIHGGLRYLQQGNIHLVREALRERGLLCKNAPHLVHHLPFLVPNYQWWEGPFYGFGLKVYDMLAGKLGIEHSRHLNLNETLEAIPTLEPQGLRGGVIYYDGQFDDARLAICLAQTAASHGATLLNYCEVTSLIKRQERCVGVRATDRETGKQLQISGRVVINATGVFSDRIMHMDNAETPPMIAPSQGVHIVLDKSFQPGKTAIMVPHTADKRVLFLVPWHDRLLLGTTDTPVTRTMLEPHPFNQEIDFLLSTAAQYLAKDPTKADVLSIFAGLRPLIKAGKRKSTAALARDHTILVSPSQLVTIAGGKWTTYRKMAQDVIDKAIPVGSLPQRPCVTEDLQLYGFQNDLDPLAPLSTYGSDAGRVRNLKNEDPGLVKQLHPNLPYIWAEILWGIRHEMGRTVEDLLSRRTRALLLDAKATLGIAPRVANMLAKELGKDAEWARNQVETYTQLARNYYLE